MIDPSAATGPGSDHTDHQKDRPNDTGAPLRLRELDVERYLSDPGKRQQFVTPMFDVIAPRYDAFTRLFSFGMDAAWKREALNAVVARVTLPQQASASAARTAQSAATLRALDLACGTGDFAVALAAELPLLTVTGIDASPRMIEQAQERLANATPSAATHRVTMQVGDMMCLEAATASIDVVTAGYGVRNVPEPAVAVREMARVMRPGATLVTLDFYRPESALWRTLLLGYLAAAGNVVGWLWHRDPVVYGYIARSIDHFMSWQSFSRLLEREGFTVHRVVRHLGGGIALHIATRR